jgi:hypothetical protein
MNPMKNIAATDAKVKAIRKLLFFCSGVMVFSSANHAGGSDVQLGWIFKGMERGW